ncbi:MAG: class I SAM-dependent methyltransferase [Victivallaceae bacterium]|nr:class I SAM-dependent methyltransferase [Victivallaceae bacterium]
MTDKRIEREIKHGRYLTEHGASDIWNWSSPAGIIRFQRRVAMLSKYLHPGLKVLELGCGTGLFTAEFVRSGADLIALDISEELLDQARHHIKFPNVKFVNGNAYSTDFEDNSFDAIIGSSVLHHLEIEKALTEIHRLLKPGGSAAFTEPNMLNPQIALQKNIPYLKQKLGDSPDETAFFAGQLRRLLRRHSFSKIQVTPFDFLHPALPAKSLKIMNPFSIMLEKIPIIKAIAGSLYLEFEKPKTN